MCEARDGRSTRVGLGGVFNVYLRNLTELNVRLYIYQCVWYVALFVYTYTQTFTNIHDTQYKSGE